MSTERILPRIIVVNWRVKLILKQWQLGILEQGMNCSDGNKLHFTNNWQIDNEHFVILVLEVFIRWKNWREIRNFEEFSRRRMVENHFKDVESVRSGSISHVPSQPALFPLLREPGGLLIRDYNLQPNTWDTHGLSGNVFANPQASYSTTYSGMLNPLISLSREIFRCKQVRGDP